MTSQQSTSFEHNLLIVESPTVARIIDQFELPYLTVIATHGFCWKPKYDNQRRKLKLQAAPGKRSIRNQIRDQAKWATQVIIATDTDASGDVIAHGIDRHLKNHDVPVFRTSLQALSPASIQEIVKNASPLKSENLTNRLKNRYLLSEQFEQVRWPVPVPKKFHHAILALVSLIYGKHRHAIFIDQTGDMFIAPESINIPYGQQIDLLFDEKHREFNRQKHPLSTADALTLIKGKSSRNDLQFQKIQLELNELFTTVPTDIDTGLISYPRTSAQGYYASTWKLIQREWIKSNELETLCPSAVQPRVNEIEEHEAIHPFKLTNEPSVIRPFVRRRHFLIYKWLYQYHVNVIQKPEVKKVPVFRDTSSHNRYLLLSKSQDTSPRKIKPYMNTADLLNKLANLRAIRPSRMGKFLDFILDNRFIDIKRYEFIVSGTKLKQLHRALDQPDQIKPFLKFINQNIEQRLDPNVTSDYLDSIFTSS